MLENVPAGQSLLPACKEREPGATQPLLEVDDALARVEQKVRDSLFPGITLQTKLSRERELEFITGARVHLRKVQESMIDTRDKKGLDWYSEKTHQEAARGLPIRFGYTEICSFETPRLVEDIMHELGVANGASISQLRSQFENNITGSNISWTAWHLPTKTEGMFGYVTYSQYEKREERYTVDIAFDADTARRIVQSPLLPPIPKPAVGT